MSRIKIPRLQMYTGSAAFKASMGSTAPESDVDDDQSDPILDWRRGKISQLEVVNITGALVAGVVSSAFSWPTIDTSPWTSKACLYAALILALAAVVSGSQQSIALHHVGSTTNLKFRKHLYGKKDRHLVPYIWQIPVMMLNISILIFLLGLLILIWDRAAVLKIWGSDMKIAFVATLAGVFALGNYVAGSIFIWRMNSELFSTGTSPTDGAQGNAKLAATGHDSQTGEKKV